MAVKVSQQRDHGVMTDNVKLISMILLSVSIFFSIIFFSIFQATIGFTEIGLESDDSYLFVYLVTVTALSVAIIAMEFYHIRHRALAMFKYAVIVANGVLLGFTIHELSKGYDNIFQDPPAPATNFGGATLFAYGALATGFAGVGTLLAVLHNFHGIVGAV